MANKKILSVFIFFTFLFACCGGLLLTVPILSRQSTSQPPTPHWVAQNILLNTTTLTLWIIDSIAIFASVCLALPSFFSSSNLSKHTLTAHAYTAVLAAIFTLGLGLRIWFSTLQSKAGLAPVWNNQPSATQTLLQEKFNCCGYADSAIFIKDALCSSVERAAELGPCVNTFSQFADQFLAVVFTVFFGIVTVTVLLLMSGLCLMKERSEEVRYRTLDRKAGYRNI